MRKTARIAIRSISETPVCRISIGNTRGPLVRKAITVTSFQHSEDVAPTNVAGPGIAAMLN